HIRPRLMPSDLAASTSASYILSLHDALPICCKYLTSSSFCRPVDTVIVRLDTVAIHDLGWVRRNLLQCGCHLAGKECVALGNLSIRATVDPGQMNDEICCVERGCGLLGVELFTQGNPYGVNAIFLGCCPDVEAEKSAGPGDCNSGHEAFRSAGIRPASSSSKQTS